MAAKWLKDTVFYEIYPQSFKDTNSDGIGDFNGIIEKLDYIKSLGCNALWINPCYDSPFKDAGYDVRDYKKVAPRYGTNEDLYRLFDKAHEKGIRVLLDLVPGHTSEEHPWFVESQKVEKNEYSDRFIWTDFCFQGAGGLPYVGGESERSGCYILNFFKCQPALNYGFYKVTEPWQKSFRDPAAIATREALKDIMRFLPPWSKTTMRRRAVPVRSGRMCAACWTSSSRMPRWWRNGAILPCPCAAATTWTSFSTSRAAVTPH